MSMKEEFSLKGGNVNAGIYSAVGGGIKYMIAPLFFLIIVSGLLAQVGQTSLLDNLGLGEMRFWILVTGIPITILCFFRGFYQKGSISRMLFALGVTAFICIWIWKVTRGGNIALSMSQINVSLAYTGFVYLFLLAAILRGVYYIAEMFSYRRDASRSAKPMDGGSRTNPE